jgi:hypothetical protein
MPSNHGAVPLFERPVLLGLQSVFTPLLFQSYFDAKFFGFVLWGESVVNVSQFVAKIRPWESDTLAFSEAFHRFMRPSSHLTHRRASNRQMLSGQIQRSGHHLRCVGLGGANHRSRNARLTGGSNPSCEASQNQSCGGQEPEFAHWRPLPF